MDIQGLGIIQQNTEQVKNSKQDDSFAEKLQKAYDDNDREQLKKACKEFEGIFMQILYKQMKATVQKSDLIPESAGTNIFEDMLDEEMMNNAKEKGIGVSDMLYKQMEKQIDNIYSTNGQMKKENLDEKK